MEQVCFLLVFILVLIVFSLISQIFGVLPVNDDDENRVPSTIDRIREQRAARKAQQNNGDSGNQNDEQGTSALCSLLY